MKRVLMVIFLFFAFVSVASAAPSAGMLRGKSGMVSGPGTTGTTNVNAINDGNEVSVGNMSGGYAITYDLGANYTIDGYYLHTDGAYGRMRLLDASNNVLGTYTPSNVGESNTSTSYKSITPINGVRKVEVSATTSSEYFYEADVHAGVAPSPSPTPAPTPTPSPSPTPSPTPTPIATPSPTPSPTPVPLIVNALPNKDSIIMQISGGAKPYTVTWPGHSQSVNVSQYTILGLISETSYAITVTDSKGVKWTGTVNTGSEKAYVPPTMPNPQDLFQRMLDVFGTAGTIAIAVISGAILLGILCVLALWGWRLFKQWLARAK